MKHLLVGLSILFCSIYVFSQETIEKEYKTAPGQLLDVELHSGGSLSILGWDRETVRIKVLFGKHDDPDNFGFEFNELLSGITIKSNLINPVREKVIGMETFIHVPKRHNLNLRTSGGSIKIEDIEGKINGRTGGGNITLRDSKLDGDVHTAGGNVLIENVVGDIEGHSAGGEVVYKNVVTPKKTYPKDLVYIRNTGGSINVIDAPRGADVATAGGDIHIHSALEFVKAETAAGDITIDKADGWVEATTFAGNIYLKMTGNIWEGKRRDVTLLSWLGDITLVVPPDLPIDVDITLGRTIENKKDYKIFSDFSLVMEKSDKWISEHGTQINYIHSIGTVGSGYFKIRLKTVNGNIYLKKRTLQTSEGKRKK